MPVAGPIAGAAAGVVLNKALNKSPGQAGSTSTTTEPWSGLMPYLQGYGGTSATPGYYKPGTEGHWSYENDSANWIPGAQGEYVPGSPATPGIPGLLPEAARLYQSNNPQYFPGNTIAPLSNETQQSLNLQAQRALGGSPLNQAATQANMDTLSGAFLNSNPYLDDTFKRASGAVRSQIDSQFAKSGRYGSGLHQDTMQKNYNDLATAIYGNNYANERKLQENAIRYAPTLANQDYFDIGQLAQVGSARDALAQQVLNEEINRYNFNQNLPMQKLQQYAALLGQGGMSGGFGTSTQPYFTNPLAGNIGLGLAGAQMFGKGFTDLFNSMGNNNSYPVWDTFGGADYT